jgi:hypothetical protein
VLWGKGEIMKNKEKETTRIKVKDTDTMQCNAVIIIIVQG